MTTTTKARLGVAAVSISLAGLLAACGSSASEGSDATTTAAEGTSSTTEAETTTTSDDGTTSTTENDEGTDTETTELDSLPDGKHYGHIAGVEDGMVEGQEVQVIIFDPLELLTGQEAIDAAAEDGVELDSDFYLRDPEATVLRIAVVPDASVTTLNDGSMDQVPSSVSEVAGQDGVFVIDVGNVRDITTISSIEGVYFP